MGARSPVALLNDNLETLLRLLKNHLLDNISIDEHLLTELVPELSQRLEISKFDWNWLTPATSDPLTSVLLEIAIVCLDNCTDAELIFQLMVVISLYTNENVPWSNRQLSEIATTVQRSKCILHIVRFAHTIISMFLPVSAPKMTTILNSQNGRTRYIKTKTPRPALGLQNFNIAEDAKRSEWKTSVNVAVLSSVIFLMDLDVPHAYIAKCASFVLNVMDDPDPLFRAQGCFLLHAIIRLGHGEYLVKSGLISVFKESTKTCLAYLPQLTPAKTSLRLLKDGAYPALFLLLAQNEDASYTAYTTYLEVLDNHLLALISHVLGRGNDADTNALLEFFFMQISGLILGHLKLLVLACFSRLNFVISQTLTNPYLIESEDGDRVVAEALRVQKTALELCLGPADSEAPKLFLHYKLDFLGAWTILARRMVKFGIGNDEINGILRENVTLLREIAKKVDLIEVEQDLKELLEKVPEILGVLLEIGK